MDRKLNCIFQKNFQMEYDGVTLTLANTIIFKMNRNSKNIIMTRFKIERLFQLRHVSFN